MSGLEVRKGFLRQERWLAGAGFQAAGSSGELRQEGAGGCRAEEGRELCVNGAGLRLGGAIYPRGFADIFCT